MNLSVPTRRLLWLVAAVGVLGGGVLAARLWLGDYAVRYVLRLAGASEIQFKAVRGTPWHLEVDDLSFSIQTQAYAARRVVLDREHWWTASLGAVRVEGAEMPVYLDGSDVNPLDWATYDNPNAADEAVNLPLTTLDLDGRIVVKLSSLPDMPLDVKLEGRPKGGVSWIGSAVVNGPGFHLAGGGALLRAGQELEFQVHSAELDLGVWAQQLRRLVLLPGAPWDFGGKLTGVGEGRVTAKRFAATARISLREGWMKAAARDIAAKGIEADLEFSDLWKYRTKSGVLRLAELKVGRMNLTDVTADFGMWGAKTFTVNAARARLLGGEVSVAPCRYFLERPELRLVLTADQLDPAQVLALAPEVPVQLPGRIAGSVPLLIQSMGVRLQSGFLELQPPAGAELAVNAPALLRSGGLMDDATIKALKSAGGEPARMKLSALRLEIRPPDAPLGSSGRVRLAGEVGGAPVAITLNVNRSLESYLQVMR